MNRKLNKFLPAFLILIMFFLISFMFSFQVYAADCTICGSDKHTTPSQNNCFGKPEDMEEPFQCPICGYIHDMANISSINKTAYDMECIIKGGGTVDGNLETILKFDVTDASTEFGSSFVSLWNRGRNFYDSLSKIGELLCVVYGLIELMEKVQLSQLDGEQIFKSFIKIFIGIIVIRSGFEIITAGMAFATGVFDTLQGGSASPNSAVTKCPYVELSNSWFLNGIGKIAGSIMPWIVMQIATLLMQLIVWARLLDLMVRVVFAPIGMADIMYGGMNSNGMKYLKKMVSASIQGAVLLAILISYGTIISTVNGIHTLNVAGTSNSALMINIILTFTLISTLYKAKEFADSMLGV